MTIISKRLITIAGAAALAIAVGPLAANAQAPSYALNPATTITGTVASVNGKYAISVRDDRGFIDNVSLHDGTIINPTGLTLAPGEQVTIEGSPAGGTFVADEINTPYSSYAAYPYPGYAARPYPAVSLGIGFGFGGGFRR